jgi:hypothetical protein
MRNPRSVWFAGVSDIDRHLVVLLPLGLREEMPNSKRGGEAKQRPYEDDAKRFHASTVLPAS